MTDMSQQENRADSYFADWGETLANDFDTIGLSATRVRAVEEAGHSIARQLNGHLTTLLLYMEELKQHSHRFSREAGSAIICTRWSRMRGCRRSASAHWSGKSAAPRL